VLLGVDTGIFDVVVVVVVVVEEVTEVVVVLTDCNNKL
jgi:hypothetical protein